MRTFRSLALCLGLLVTMRGAAAQAVPAKVLLFFSLNGESDHTLFATQAIQFFAEQADKHGFRVEATTNWTDLNDANLKDVALVVWLNAAPPEPRHAAFERYMEHGGAWLGFHVSAYNDKDSRWPWFRQFLGGSVFGVNSWPPLPARIVVEDTESPITRGMPRLWTSPKNEWYSWRPSPRLDKRVKVLLSLDPAQYPLGIKSLITSKEPDVPVAWTNTKFRMIYINMGHGDKVFTNPIQDGFFENAILWLLGTS